MPIIAPLVDADALGCVDFDPWPQNDGASHTDIVQLVDQGKVILWQPTLRVGDTLVARVLKALVYAATFSRDDLDRPIAVIMDEAQRFVTNDVETGEASFLDRCRAYRCNVLLATQSIASLEHALGSGLHARSALDILLANTPSKWFMRSSDAQTKSMAQALLPPAPLSGSPHVVQVRPPVSLDVGEGYWVLGAETGRPMECPCYTGRARQRPQATRGSDVRRQVHRQARPSSGGGSYTRLCVIRLPSCPLDDQLGVGNALLVAGLGLATGHHDIGVQDGHIGELDFHRFGEDLAGSP